MLSLGFCPHATSRLQGKELLKLEEFQKGDIPQALGRAFLRIDELLVEENHLEELKTLAGPKDKR